MMLQAVTPPPNVILTTTLGGGIYGPREHLQYRGHLQSLKYFSSYWRLIQWLHSSITQINNFHNNETVE
jgi:hypothetical protein